MGMGNLAGGHGPGGLAARQLLEIQRENTSEKSNAQAHGLKAEWRGHPEAAASRDADPSRCRQPFTSISWRDVLLAFYPRAGLSLTRHTQSSIMVKLCVKPLLLL